jgi:hypothetical protein
LKIAFWSNCGEKCNVSSNLAAISVASVIRYPYSVVLVENRLNNHNLGKAFTGNSIRRLREDASTNYYDGDGIEGLLRKIYRNNGCIAADHNIVVNSSIATNGSIATNNRIIKNDSYAVLRPYLKEIINRHLYYIPQGHILHNEIFEYEFNHCFQPLLQLLKGNFNICMLHAASQKNLSTKTILQEADLIVVNLNQNKYYLEDFFDNYSSMIPKAVFIISNYDSEALLSRARISWEYRIPLENILAIPDNVSYQNAYHCSSVIEFIYHNYSCPKTNPNYTFIQAIKKAAFQIIKRAEASARELSAKNEGLVMYCE